MTSLTGESDAPWAKECIDIFSRELTCLAHALAQVKGHNVVVGLREAGLSEERSEATLRNMDLACWNAVGLTHFRPLLHQPEHALQHYSR